MKNSKFFILIFLLAVILFAFNSKDQKDGEKQNDSVGTSASSPIDGSWDLVWSSHNGKDDNLKKSSQFKMFHNGFFSMIAWDSMGKFAYSGYGKFELEGNTYKETHLYNDNPKYVGAIDWQEYELKGDTLYSKGFIKVVLVNGGDKTADFPRIEEKRVRAK